MEGLVAAGESLPASDALRRAEAFLLSKQNPNGGWGESYLACVNKAYPQDGTGQVSASRFPSRGSSLSLNLLLLLLLQQLGDHGSGVVQTSWALLALLAAGCQDQAAIAKAAAFLIAKQVRLPASRPIPAHSGPARPMPSPSHC